MNSAHTIQSIQDNIALVIKGKAHVTYGSIVRYTPASIAIRVATVRPSETKRSNVAEKESYGWCTRMSPRLISSKKSAAAR